ncbi:hypothetical protein [Streptacidiphilus sp. EB129]|uniref:hypothetical protein n=1 Tax=Streptacidiphilus sp. EB129 TaxID=3156262 RepID=UPI003518C5B0
MEPLPDTRLEEIRARVTAEAICPAAHPDETDKGHVWVTGSLSGRDRCSACSVSRRVVDTDEAALLAELDRLRAESEQRLGELLFWHFEYREAMDNYRGENWQVGQLRAQLAAAEGLAAGYGARIVAASMAAAPLNRSPEEQPDA